MSYSNTTPNYKLPIFSPEDKPSWLGAWNTAMSNIDTGMYNGVSATDLIKEDINALKTSMSTAEGNIEEIQEDIENINTKIQGVESVMYYPVPSGAYQALANPQYQENAKTLSISTTGAFSGGFVLLSLGSGITDVNEHMIQYDVKINGVSSAISKQYFLTKNLTGVGVYTDPVFIPPCDGLELLIGIDGAPTEAAKVNVLVAPYITLPVPVVKGGN